MQFDWCPKAYDRVLCPHGRLHCAFYCFIQDHTIPHSTPYTLL